MVDSIVRSQLYDSWNRWAFVCRRKVNSDEAALICADRLFHARAAATGKARSPRVIPDESSLVTVRRPVVGDLDEGVEWWQLELQDVQSSSQIVATNKPTPICFACRMLFLSPSQQCQNTEGKQQQKTTPPNSTKFGRTAAAHGLWKNPLDSDVNPDHWMSGLELWWDCGYAIRWATWCITTMDKFV